MTRRLKPNGTGGSKFVTFPKDVLNIAGMDKCKTVEVEVKAGMIILRKGEV